jgi:hypothetical protein
LEYNYSIITYDPNGDDVYYWISWYEDYPVNIWNGPYESGEEVKINFTYHMDGIYIIRIKSKDIYDKESEWATLKITMPKLSIKSQLSYFFPFLINKYFNIF